VVYASVDGHLDCGVPSAAPVALHPWSPAGLRIWLRDALRGEASETLVSWLMSRSGGLPASAERELGRLQERDNLTRTPDGGWTVTSAAISRPRRHTQLPVSMTELVGRTTERHRVATLLATNRLITLAGPGGVGKTRLALAVAADVADTFGDGAVFLALADAREPDEVVAEIAAALGVEAIPGQQLLTNIIEYLADVPMLLVLDNFEQVMGAADAVGELLKGAPGLKIVVTSRERLSLYGERVYQVLPLGLPNLNALPVGKAGVARALAEFPALALFEQRAQAVDDAFVLTETTLPAVAGLCHRLDGLPLPIELAAARTDRWPPHLLLVSLQNHLAALGEGPRDLPARQQTLRGAIAWSVALLDPADQRLFTELAVFAGGCTVEAAVAVTGDVGAAQLSRTGSADRGTVAHESTDALATLAHKNLLIMDTNPDGVVRYRMLETIRAYAMERLDDAPNASAVRRRHADRYIDLADRLAEELTGPEQIAWTVQLETERQNLREALGATLAMGEVERAARICLGLWRYWASGAHLEDGRAWFDRLLAAPQGLSETTAVKVYYAAAGLAAEREDHEAATELAGAGLRCAESIGDREGAAWARVALGIAADTRGDYRVAYEHHSEALAVWRELHHARGIPIALGNLARVTWRLGDTEAAHRYAIECLARERAAGNSRNVLLGLECLAGILLERHDVSGARDTLRESLALSRELDDEYGAAMSIHQSGQAAVLDGDHAGGLRLFVEALSRRQELGDRGDLAISLDSVASLVVTTDGCLAAELSAAAQGLRIRYSLPTPPEVEVQRQATEARLRTTVAESVLTAAGIAGRTAPLDVIINRALDALRQTPNSR
jgi:predicted ATPase